jgi:hypothetical protein
MMLYNASFHERSWIETPARANRVGTIGGFGCVASLPVAFCLGAGCAATRMPAPSEARSQNMSYQSAFVGQWQRITQNQACRQYPQSIDFRVNGQYFGVPAEEGEYTCWDVGTFVVVGPTEVKISTANDAIIPYQCAISGDTLTFTDENGVEIRYRRTPAAGP